MEIKATLGRSVSPGTTVASLTEGVWATVVRLMLRDSSKGVFLLGSWKEKMAHSRGSLKRLF